MNPASWVILGLIVFWLIFSVVYTRRKRKRGGCTGCGGGCASCAYRGSCNNHQK